MYISICNRSIIVGVCVDSNFCSDTKNVVVVNIFRPQHMWLTPVLPNSYARIFFIFDAPTFVSRIRIFNYRKTPERGVHHIAVMLLYD